MKTSFDTQTEDVRIEILPLIDVIFCILTFFILAAVGLTRQQAITVDLPKASNATTPQIASRLLVSINPYNQIYVENQLVSPEQLEQRLREFNQQNPTGLMVLYASKTAFYNDVVQVLDKMQSVGGDRVALATLPESDASQQLPASGYPLPPATGVPGAAPYPGTNPPATGVPGAYPPATGVPGAAPYPGTNQIAPGSLPTLPDTTAPTPGGGTSGRSRSR